MRKTCSHKRFIFANKHHSPVLIENINNRTTLFIELTYLSLLNSIFCEYAIC